MTDSDITRLPIPAQPPATRIQMVRPSSASVCGVMSALGRPSVRVTARISAAIAASCSRSADDQPLVCGLPPELDAVADLQTTGLAGFLGEPDRLPGHAGSPELLGEFEIEGDRQTRRRSPPPSQASASRSRRALRPKARPAHRRPRSILSRSPRARAPAAAWSAAATAAATAWVRLPKRLPRARKFGFDHGVDHEQVAAAVVGHHRPHVELVDHLALELGGQRVPARSVHEGTRRAAVGCAPWIRPGPSARARPACARATSARSARVDERTVDLRPVAQVNGVRHVDSTRRRRGAGGSLR